MKAILINCILLVFGLLCSGCSCGRVEDESGTVSSSVVAVTGPAKLGEIIMAGPDYDRGLVWSIPIVEAGKPKTLIVPKDYDSSQDYSRLGKGDRLTVERADFTYGYQHLVHVKVKSSR
jgi:hypothetical protein